jgi:hypothetical protein
VYFSGIFARSRSWAVAAAVSAATAAMIVNARRIERLVLVSIDPFYPPLQAALPRIL